ncbi:unnamed protein product [Rhizophagus irregularis]|nr:unnamed protein product [Rhizophagus irregularis]
MDFRKSILRFVRVGFRRTENPKIRSGGLPKNENPKIHDLVGFRRKENQETKIRSGGVGFRPSGKEEPRFDRDWVEWASDLREKKNQDSIGWASDLWEKRNQDSIGWSGLPTFGKRRTKIRKSRVSQVSSEERKKPKIHKFGWIAKEQSKIHIYEYMNHVIVGLYLN